MVFNVRQKQTDIILKILNFNSQTSKDPGDTYKVLVLDRFGKDLIAPLLRVNELRRHGVTLHLLLEAERQAIPDVPAIYLVQPSPANMDRIINDAAQGLYDSMHLNFTSVLPNRLIEQLASGTVKADCVQRVSKVFDQYLSFISLEQSLFSLGLPHTYVELNDPSAKDSQIEAAITSIVDGLFSVFITIGVVPIIRCLRGGAAEHVAAQLDARIRDNLKSRNNLFSEGVHGLGATLSRPLLCLFDRNFDLSSALQHSWTYKPLVQDVLGMRLNKVVISEGVPGPGSSSAAAAAKTRTYDVDEHDFFWEACGTYPFPRVAEEVETQLKAYRAAVDEINQKTNQGPQEGVYDPDEQIAQNTKNLISAVSSLPELQEKKKVLDKHTNLATSLLTAIKTRALDQFHNLGEDLLSGKGDLAAVMKLIGATTGRGTGQDKLRMALIYLLSCEGIPSDSEMAGLEAAVKSAGGDTTAMAYVRTLKRNNLTGAAQKAGGPQTQEGLAGLASQSNILDWADKTFGQGLSTVTKGMKTLLGGSRQMPVVAAVEALVEGKIGTPEFESYAVFDPKAPAGKVTLERAKGPFKEAMVFMIGGGNYMERESLMYWAAKSLPPKQLIY
eukprot:gene19994-26707_t